MREKRLLSQSATSWSPPYAVEATGSLLSGKLYPENKYFKSFNRSTVAIVSALSLCVGSVWAQSDLAEDEEEIFELSPFEVSSDSNTGYGVKDTLAGARIRTSLKDTPSSLSVVTSQFLEDTNVTSAEDLLVYTMNTEVSGLNGNFSGFGNRSGGVDYGGAVENENLVSPGRVNRARGLTRMDNTRNYFPSEIPWDGYNISRVDVSRGPNSFLFGTGSPSGISNVSTNEAVFDDFGSLELNVGSYGSTRETFDYNKQFGEEFAVRLALVNENKKFQQEPAFRDTKRGYLALRYEPEFLKSESASTKFQANFEQGEGKSNNPRTLPPIDYMTGYLNDPRASDMGIDPWVFNQDSTEAGADARFSHWAGAGSVGGNKYKWDGTPQFVWDDTGTLLRAGDERYGIKTGGNPDGQNTWPVHSVGFQAFARASNRIALQAGVSEADAPYPGAWAQTVTYIDQTLSDTSVFDFYNKLIDGENKREWQDWEAYSFKVNQSLFDDRLNIQGVVDHQEYNNGFGGWNSTGSPILMLDLDRYLLAGNPSWLGDDNPPTPNPNVGRPMVFSDQGKTEMNQSVRDNYQVTASYHLDFQDDLDSDGLLGKILGRHNLTGLWSQFERSSGNQSFKLNGVDSEYLRVSGHNLNALESETGFNWLQYMGPSLLGTTGRNANLPNLQHTLSLPDMLNFTYYSDEWKDDSVDPDAEWEYTNWNGEVVTGTNANNPSNYRGFVSSPFAIINGESNPWVLANSARKSEETIESKAFMYQGHLLDNTIVPSFGYREDTTKQRGANADASNDPLNLDFGITEPGSTADTKSTSYGLALHLPKALKEKLPSGTDISLYYFHGENETPKIRYGMDGQKLPNEAGVTDDYSLQFDGFNGRLTARLTYFKTVNENSSAYVGVPLATWLVRGLPDITLQYFAWGAAERQLYDELGVAPEDRSSTALTNAPASWDTWRTTANHWRPHGWMDDRPEDWLAFEEAMKTTFTEFYPQEYWDAWGYNINAEAIKNGDWFNIVNGTDNPWDISKFGGNETIDGQFPTLEQNVESKGWELETTIRPRDNWDITFNASKVDATQTGFGERADAFIQDMKAVYVDSPVGYGNVWGGFETSKNMFNGDVWSKYLIQTALEGSPQPEQRRYRFNFVTNYRFEEGVAKGFNVGGAYRWEDKAIHTYGIYNDETVGWLPNVDDPIYGPTNEHVDAWIGYSGTMTEKIDWNVQLNVRNLGENTKLVPIAYQPTGEPAQFRIQTGAEYNLRLKFMF
ncbi:TonB-dependent receptor plug domain-containing protein [Pelagicoccus sp. SDUM812003]|uniref:TonB-dependent receptor plug domain-containing protein n=1 Tax=Pelagicoccus sp. SDUM812003 TaxID=3041267 RepID=UPI00280CF1BF|nr:TonB-dependent receptor plug domain-containing protein [Pelagicoccus sp. SDUM812003]MDQ8202191.1 TonB-dependent receptor plug domain-containing protein [Pelagicoccus sp. SDUM812003]